MRVIDLKTNTEATLPDKALLSCAVGNFDGVHIGHAELLKEAAKKEGSCTHSAVFTFSVNSHLFIGTKPACIITDEDQKNRLFRDFGIDYAIYENFPDIRDLSPESFIQDELIRLCHVRHVICGKDFRFGCRASGNAEMLSDAFRTRGLLCSVINILEVGGQKVSSTEIRGLIENGKMEEANLLLGHPFSILQPVQNGNHIGRTLGFPTINQYFPENYVVPKFGVYASKTRVDGKEYLSVTNVGIKPTVKEKEKKADCETHLLNFSGDLYGRTPEVSLYRFLRTETKFENLDALTHQMETDKKNTLSYFHQEEKQ